MKIKTGTELFFNLRNSSVPVFIQNLVNFIFPITCTVCGQYLSANDSYRLCDNCMSKIEFIKPLYCQKCGIPLRFGGAHCYSCLYPETKIYYEYIRGICVYDGVIKRCVHLFKYNNKDYLTGLFSSLLIDYMKVDEGLSSVDIIVPVPLHWYKRFKRGYNQSELLARKVAKVINKTLILDNLRRKKYTKSQVSLNRNLRLANVKDAFVVKHPEIFSKKNVLVIDDVCTTGETINQCAKVLIESKVKKVYGLTVARDA